MPQLLLQLLPLKGQIVTGSRLLLACEGMQPELVQEDPWFAGWSAVLVNLNDIAAMVDYLASEEGGYVTGQVFSIDGGMAI